MMLESAGGRDLGLVQPTMYSHEGLVSQIHDG